MLEKENERKTLQEDKAENVFYLENKLGKIEYREKSIYKFPDGLYGYKEFKKFIIWAGEKYRPFKLLISIDDPELFFSMINPKILIPDYKPKINDVKEWELIYTLVTIGSSPDEVTVNMRAPILLSRIQHWGKQVILTDSYYLIRHKIINSLKLNGE